MRSLLFNRYTQVVDHSLLIDDDDDDCVDDVDYDDVGNDYDDVDGEDFNYVCHHYYDDYLDAYGCRYTIMIIYCITSPYQY
jgi:hypothetical protein